MALRLPRCHRPGRWSRHPRASYSPERADGSSTSPISTRSSWDQLVIWTNRFSDTRLTCDHRQSSQTSLTWTDFFDQELFLPEDVDNLHIVHHVYLTPPTESGPLFVMHHGAGSSGLSFATCAEEIRKILPKAGILSLDARSHGRTVVTTLESKTGDNAPYTAAAAQAESSGQVELDLRLETLSRDLVHVIHQTQTRMGWEKLPDIILVGHSLGGAVITDVAKKGELGPKLLAYAVFDVVEGVLAFLVYIYLILISLFNRVCNGCSPEYGEISFDSSHPISIPDIWN